MKIHMIINVDPDGHIVTRHAYNMAAIAERRFREEIVAQGLYHSEWVFAFPDFQMLLDAINHDHPNAHYELRTIPVR